MRSEWMTAEPQVGGVRVIPSNEYRRERWRNQMGWTREIARGRVDDGLSGGASGDEPWDWRLSIAEVERDSAFSSFPGIERELVLLSGNGIRLRFEDGETHELTPPHGRMRFAGERVVGGELLDGPSHDFNLMWRRDRVAADLWHRPLVGAMVIFAEPGQLWMIHVLAGHADFERDTGLPSLGAGDTALLRAGDTKLRQVIDGGGELLLARITPADAD